MPFISRVTLALLPCSRDSSRTQLHGVAAAQMWAGDYEGPHAALVATLLGGGDAKTLAKATCEGLGGGVTVIKKAGCGAGGAGGGWPEGVGEAGYAALEGAQAPQCGGPPAVELPLSVALCALGSLHWVAPELSITSPGPSHSGTSMRQHIIARLWLKSHDSCIVFSKYVSPTWQCTIKMERGRGDSTTFCPEPVSWHSAELERQERSCIM